MKALISGAVIVGSLAFTTPAEARVPEDLAMYVEQFSAVRGCPADDMECIVRDVWPDDLEDRAWHVVQGKTPGRCAWGESGGNPTAVHRNKDGSTDHGLFQVNSTWKRTLVRAGFDWDQVKVDGRENARAGLWIYTNTKSGWRSWTCSPRSWGRKG